MFIIMVINTNVLVSHHNSVELLGFFARNILREINFEDSKSSKAANFTVSKVLKFVNVVNCSFQKLPIMKILTS